MRLTAILLAGALSAGCTSGDITVPSDPVLQQVTPSPGAVSAGGDAFAATIEGALAEPGSAPLPQQGTPLDADTLNLTLYTIEQQKIDARIAERELAEARSRLVVVQPNPSSVPRGVEGVNIALFAQQTTNAVGERIYPRNLGLRGAGACGRFRTADEAQRAFLAAGGPAADPRGLDPDGDGFACSWDPAPYRQLRL
jgi:hypothetical protein